MPSERKRSFGSGGDDQRSLGAGQSGFAVQIRMAAGSRMRPPHGWLREARPRRADAEPGNFRNPSRPARCVRMCRRALDVTPRLGFPMLPVARGRLRRRTSEAGTLMARRSIAKTPGSSATACRLGSPGTRRRSVRPASVESSGTAIVGSTSPSMPAACTTPFRTSTSGRIGRPVAG